MSTAVLLASACTATPEPDDGSTPSALPTTASPSPTTSPSPTASPSPSEASEATTGTLAYVDRVFGADEEPPPRLVVVEVPDGEPHTIAEGALGGTAWSPEGGRIAVIARPATAEGPGQEQLLVADVAAGTTTVAATGNFLFPTWSPDGQQLAVSSTEPNEATPLTIVVVDAATSEVTTVTDPPQGSDDLDPDWSPDGRRLVFLRSGPPAPTSEDPERTQVLSVARDGTDARVLAPGLFDEGPPTWSSDGGTVALTAATSPGTEAPRHLFLAPSDGGEAMQLDVPGARDDVAFSPDGRMVAVAAGGRPDDSAGSDAGSGDSDIHVVDVADGSVVATFDADALDLSPTWSPDGTHVAFVAATGLEGQADIALGEVASGEVELLTDDGSVDAPDFAPR